MKKIVLIGFITAILVGCNHVPNVPDDNGCLGNWDVACQNKDLP